MLPFKLHPRLFPVICAVACFFVPASMRSQAVKIWPKHPTVGDTLQISYNPADPAATLPGSEDIYVKVTAYQENGGYHWYKLPVKTANGAGARFVLPGGTASLTFRFYTLNKDDEPALTKMYVYNKKTGVPVRSAYLDDLFTGDAAAVFAKEIATYADNYLAYAKYFNVISMIKAPADASAIIREHLQSLEKTVHSGRSSAGLLAALCIGQAKLNQLPAAKTYLLQLFSLFPREEETAFAFSIYNYEYYKATTNMIEDDVREGLARVFKKWPHAAVSADANITEYLGTDRSLSVSDFENALLPRYDDGTIPYYAMTQLPDVYIARKERLDSAARLLRIAIGLFRDGQINHQYRLSANHYNLYVPVLYQKLAQVHLLQRRPAEVIDAVTTALSLIVNTNNEGNFLPGLLNLRASAFRQLGNLNMAMEDYKRLYRSGAAEAADSIRDIFSSCTTSDQSVDSLLASLRGKQIMPESSATIAPDFTGTDLAGKQVRLSSLKGKIVVLNFWGTGCGPCIAEMPELNRLVKKYGSSEAVTFLALTGDETERLKQFFKKRKFLYTIVNHMAGVTETYNIEALPVHLVIGKNGEILNRSVGARKDIFDYLDRIITSNL